MQTEVGALEALEEKRKELGIVKGPQISDLEDISDSDDEDEDSDSDPECIQVVVELNTRELEMLEFLVCSGLHGQSIEECCERLIARQLEQSAKK